MAKRLRPTENTLCFCSSSVTGGPLLLEPEKSDRGDEFVHTYVSSIVFELGSDCLFQGWMFTHVPLGGFSG